MLLSRNIFDKNLLNFPKNSTFHVKCNLFTMEHQGVHKTSFRSVGALHNLIGIWKCWFLGREENRSICREPRTNSTHIWRQVREPNPGHIGWRRALPPLCQPCSYLFIYLFKVSVQTYFLMPGTSNLATFLFLLLLAFFFSVTAHNIFWQKLVSLSRTAAKGLF